jgi:starch synthase
MRILLASSEVHPYSKTGGLADMVGALAKALAQARHQVGVVTPLYQGVRERFPQIKRLDWHFDLPLGGQRLQAELWAAEPAERLTIYFVHRPEFYHRGSLYQQSGVDYPDNAERFIFFSKCVAKLARCLPWKPGIVHVNDWQTGLVPLLIRHQAKAEGWENAPRTCLAIHNLAYQGLFPADRFRLTDLPWDYFVPQGAEFYGALNCLKAGICFADVLATVSPRYAREITTEEYGYRLDGLLRRRQGQLFGILNGVDYEEWKTTNNPYLRHSYSAQRLSGKAAEKVDLQKELGLPAKARVPLFGSITRLAEQKGVDIQLAALEEMLSSDLQFILLGSGEPRFENAYRSLAKRFPDKVALRIGFDQGLSHRIEAGCDFFLMPSLFEPCGLNQLYSQHYGTIPIVRATGGLDDTVIDITEDAQKATGIKFREYSSRATSKAMRKALALYHHPILLRHIRRNAMASDFSWKRTAQHYEALYRRGTDRPA